MFEKVGELYGHNVLRVPIDGDPMQHIKDLRKMEVKDDDVFVLAYPKCGTHWVWEMVTMLLNQTSEYSKRTKEFVMMEFMDVDKLKEEPSPRVFNSHHPMVFLPQEIPNSKAKIIQILRNPKDVIVSRFFHQSQKPNFANTTMEEYIREVLSSNEGQFEYLHQFTSWQSANPNIPVQLFYYEDIKRNPVGSVKEMANFLELSVSDELCSKIADACGFDKMKKHDVQRLPPKTLAEKEKLGKKMQFYRKGEIGDWKNHFTVALNENIDEYIKERSKGLPYKFTYVL